VGSSCETSLLSSLPIAWVVRATCYDGSRLKEGGGRGPAAPAPAGHMRHPNTRMMWGCNGFDNVGRQGVNDEQCRRHIIL
jgi:hypothetical protein